MPCAAHSFSCIHLPTSQSVAPRQKKTDPAAHTEEVNLSSFHCLCTNKPTTYASSNDAGWSCKESRLAQIQIKLSRPANAFDTLLASVLPHQPVCMNAVPVCKFAQLHLVEAAAFAFFLRPLALVSSQVLRAFVKHLQEGPNATNPTSGGNKGTQPISSATFVQRYVKWAHQLQKVNLMCFMVNVNGL